MKKFHKMTRDRIEQLFGKKILANFPYYADFWENFIGVRSNSPEGCLLPYQLEMPNTLSDRDKISKCHEKISMRHYSQFCHLAGAHYQLEQALKALENKDVSLQHFLFWEAFDNFYQHLYSARRQMDSIWGLLRQLNANLPNDLKSYFIKKNRKDLWQRIAKWDEHVITIRNNIVHFSRIGAPFGDGSYWICLPIQKDPLWSSTSQQPQEIQEAKRKMSQDLYELESLLNKAQQFIGEELDKTFKSKGVKICDR